MYFFLDSDIIRIMKIIESFHCKRQVIISFYQNDNTTMGRFNPLT